MRPFLELIYVYLDYGAIPHGDWFALDNRLPMISALKSRTGAHGRRAIRIDRESYNGPEHGSSLIFRIMSAVDENLVSFLEQIFRIAAFCPVAKLSECEPSILAFVDVTFGVVPGIVERLVALYQPILKLLRYVRIPCGQFIVVERVDEARLAVRVVREQLQFVVRNWKVPREEEATVHSIAPFRTELILILLAPFVTWPEGQTLQARTGDVPKLPPGNVDLAEPQMREESTVDRKADVLSRCAP